MKVFISWSGKRSSHVAMALRKWLPLVLQQIDPWVSSEDIEIGQRGLNEITSSLQNSQYGIIVLTPENQEKPWINFEAGAISKQIDKSKVMPYLVRMDEAQVIQPLSCFQYVKADPGGTLRLLKSLNNSLENSKFSDEQIEELFEMWWPSLERELQNLPQEDSIPAKREQDDIVTEILENTRTLLRNTPRQSIEAQLESEFRERNLCSTNVNETVMFAGKSNVWYKVERMEMYPDPEMAHCLKVIKDLQCQGAHKRQHETKNLTNAHCYEDAMIAQAEDEAIEQQHLKEEYEIAMASQTIDEQ